MVVDVGGGPIENAVDYYRSVGGGEYLYAADEGFRVADAYGVRALGTTVVIGPSGEVSFRDDGVTQSGALLEEIEKALT